MRRKITASMLVLTMCFSMFIGGIDAKAETLSLHDKSTMEFVEISDEEVMPETIDEITANFDERMYSGSDYSLNNRARAYNSETVSTDNTDPNYALLVTNDTVTQGTIESVGEMRWYGFQVTERSKVTVLLQMVESLDADLYLFELNQETYVLDLVDGSAQEGVGLYEYYNNVLDSGIYYLAVAGYEGIGQYMFAFYQSTNDAVYEVNDSSGNATPVEFGKNFVGVIDNPNDIDYYQIVVTAPTIMQYSITTSDGYSFLYGGSSGNNAAIYNVNSATKTYKFMPGTYYFAVLSENDVYSASSTYTVNFKKIGVMSSDSSLSIVGISEDGGIVYQTNENGTLNYVNGNPVDYSYSYYNEISNSAGTQFYDIEIDTNAGAYVLLMEEYQPTPVHYISSTMPAMNVSSRPALILTYYCDTPFYKIHCRGTGAYSSNTYWDESYYARVLIDPETGKLIDIVEPNYYYHFVPQSGNSITVTGSYSMEFYNN